MSSNVIRSFVDFHAMVQSYRTGHYIFRGESSTEYKLRPKYGRSTSSTRKDWLEIEVAVLEAFIRRGSPYVTPQPANKWEWLAIAQHYGLATRLLDWTENPMVAAYFALAGLPSNDCVIYAMDQEALPQADQSKSPFDLDGVVLYEPAHVSTRIAAQAGLFMVCGRPGRRVLES
jgi:hypothetical protein